MGRTVAVVWHASFALIAAGLYFVFVLPRWWELTGVTSHALGTALRIVTGVLIALAALPVVFTLLRTRRPEFGTPRLALGLLIGSIAAQVLAGTLIVGTAISEIWLNLDSAGQWLFGIYGAAAAIALLGVGLFYLSFVAELPAPPPKPLKPKKPKQQRRSRKQDAEVAEESEETESEEDEGSEASEDEAAEDGADEAESPEAEADEAEADEAEADSDQAEATETDVASADTQSGLRPSGKRRVKKDS